MGVDKSALESIFISYKYVNNKDKLLTLGRQFIHIAPDIISYFIDKYKIVNVPPLNYGEGSEKLFQGLGFSDIDSIDNSNYENASIIHDMNKPVSDGLKNQYDYIYDGGTTEHIFNTPQVFDNIINMLKIGGIYCSVVPNNNFSGHGLYQFSPEFFLSVCSDVYGMKVLEMYIAQNESDFSTWINVNWYDKDGSGRNLARFFTTSEVYIITIAIKVSDDRKSFINDSPQQFSYETIDWKKMT